MFVLATSMRHSEDEDSRLRSTLWGATTEGKQNRARLAYRGVTQVPVQNLCVSGSPRCSTSKTPGVGRAERNGTVLYSNTVQYRVPGSKTPGGAPGTEAYPVWRHGGPPRGGERRGLGIKGSALGFSFRSLL